MTKEFPANEKIPIKNIGNFFTIKAIKFNSYKNNVIGKIIFSDKTEKYISTRTLYIKKDMPFNIPDLIKNGHLEFIPDFIKFETDKIDSITIHQSNAPE